MCCVAMVRERGPLSSTVHIVGRGRLPQGPGPAADIWSLLCDTRRWNIPLAQWFKYNDVAFMDRG